jgi:hypothetical protein
LAEHAPRAGAAAILNGEFAMADQSSLRLIGFGLGIVTMAVMVVAMFATVKVDAALGERVSIGMQPNAR